MCVVCDDSYIISKLCNIQTMININHELYRYYLDINTMLIPLIDPW